MVTRFVFLILFLFYSYLNMKLTFCNFLFESKTGIGLEEYYQKIFKYYLSSPGTILLFFFNFTNLVYSFIIQEVSLCFPKNTPINYYLIKFLVVLMKHHEGLENEKSESNLTTSQRTECENPIFRFLRVD